jgi:hypothetical protein
VDRAETRENKKNGFYKGRVTNGVLRPHNRFNCGVVVARVNQKTIDGIERIELRFPPAFFPDQLA